MVSSASVEPNPASIFAYLKNLALVASFFGIGLGMILGRSPKSMKRFFGLFAGLLFTLITFAPILRLTHLPVPGHQYEMFGHAAVPSGTWAALWILLGTWIFFAVVPGILYLVVSFFLVLGGLVGERLVLLKPLPAYGWNLAGSLAGILAFTALSFSTAPPWVWLLLGSVSYALLFLLLGIDLFLRYSAFDALTGGARTLVAAMFAALPIFFSGLIFSRAFRDVSRPGEALGVNLLGALIGGVLENAVMIGGTPILGVMGILLYALSALSLRTRSAAPMTQFT